MANFVANNQMDAANSLFDSREQFLTLSKYTDFNKTLEYYKTWVNTYEEVSGTMMILNINVFVTFFKMYFTEIVIVHCIIYAMLMHIINGYLSMPL